MKRIVAGLLIAALFSVPAAAGLWDIFLGNETPRAGEHYGLDHAEVLQKAQGGYLLVLDHRFADAAIYAGNKTVFLRTNKKYVDGQLVNGLSIYEGKTFSYTSVLGAQKTVWEFREVPEGKDPQ